MTTRLLTNPSKKDTRRVWNAGANRGARENLATLRDLNRESQRHAIQVLPVDPVPGRSLALAERARPMGLDVVPFEGRIEEIVKSPEYKGEPIIFNLDRASAIAAALEAIEQGAAAVLLYQIKVLPSGRMLGERAVLRPEEGDLRAKAVAYQKALAQVSERAGSRAIFGEGTDPAHTMLEPLIRNWFGAHCKDNLAKVLAGLEPESPPFEITWDGHESIPLHIVERESFGEPYAVVEAVAEQPDSPIARGQNFVVAEVTPAGVRLHESRRRASDARVVVKGTSTIDEHSTLERARAVPQVIENLRPVAPPVNEPDVIDAEIVSEPTPAPARRRVTARNNEIAREASLFFATALLGAFQNETVPVRTNELSRRNPIRTTD